MESSWLGRVSWCLVTVGAVVAPIVLDSVCPVIAKLTPRFYRGLPVIMRDMGSGLTRGNSDSLILPLYR